MKIKYGFKQAAACVMAFAIAATMIYENTADNYQIKTEASTYQEQISEYQQQLEAYQQQHAELDAQIEANKNNLQSEIQYQQDIQSQISTVEDTLALLSEYINNIERDIKSCEADIAQKEIEIANKQTEIEEGTDAFLARLRAMYISGTDTYASVLLESSDFYDMLMKVELIKRVAAYDDKIIDELYDLKKQLEAEQAALQEKNEELEANMADYDEQKAVQEEQRLKLQELYAQSELKVDQYQNEIDASQHEQDELSGEILDLEDEISALVEQEAESVRLEEERKRQEEERKRQEELLAQQQQSGSSSGSSGSSSSGSSGYETGEYEGSDYQTGSGIFSWPVPGYYNVTSGIGWRWGAYHKGIDISSSGIRGASICASDSGTVIKVNNSCVHDYGKSGSCGCGGGYGNYCIINHGNGYMTLYAHAQYISVSVGQEVNTGDVLGIVGSTGYSTGDHLHFEVRLNGVAQNPLNYV